MAAIDKIYVQSYDDWKKIVDYAKNTVLHVQMVKN